MTVASNGTLGGNGTINGSLELSGTLAPGQTGTSLQTLKAGKTTWNGGSVWKFDLSSTDNTSDELQIAGDFTKGSAGTFKFDFLNATPKWGQTYTLVTFDSTTFSLGDFDLPGSLATLGSGSYSASTFTLTGDSSSPGSLQFTAIPEPSTALGGLLLTAGLLRRRRGAESVKVEG